MEHVTDEDLDLYVAGRLSEEAVRVIEVHYLECAACLGRLTTLQDVVQALRPAARFWPWAPTLGGALAAGAAMFAIGLAWSTGVEPTSPSMPGPSPGFSLTQEANQPAKASLLFVLRTPERGASLPILQIPSEVEIVVFSVDAREIAGSGTTVTASLVDATGREIMTLRDLRLTSQHRAVVPVPAAALTLGAYVMRLAVSGDGDTLKIPLQIAASTPR